jgi:hypothetical protein
LLLGKAPAFKPTAKGAAAGALANARRLEQGLADDTALMAYLLSKDEQGKTSSLASPAIS